jgi:hypothetical protein
MDRYWFPLRALAVLDKNGQFATLAHRVEPRAGSLAYMLDMPEIAAPMPAGAPLPEDFRKVFPVVRVVRYRRGPTSASILLDGTSRFFTVRRGDAIIEAVRFATAFFGKGQFIPTESVQKGDAWTLTQRLESGYYQPIAETVTDWPAARPKRKVTELCKLEQSAEIQEIKDGFRLNLKSTGTPHIPLTIEIGLREGSTIHRNSPTSTTIRRGKNAIHITHAPEQHKYYQVRGAQPALPGPNLHITGYTPYTTSVEIKLE